MKEKADEELYLDEETLKRSRKAEAKSIIAICRYFEVPNHVTLGTLKCKLKISLKEAQEYLEMFENLSKEEMLPYVFDIDLCSMIDK